MRDVGYVNGNGVGNGLASREEKDARGVAAIEFALVAPVFFLLLLGIAAYRIYFSAISSLQRCAARTPSWSSEPGAQKAAKVEDSCDTGLLV